MATSCLKKNDVTFRTHNKKAGIAICHSVDGLGIEIRWGLEFVSPPFPSRPTVGPKDSPVQWVQGLLPGHKAAGAWS